MASDFRLKEQLPNLTEAIVATYTPEDVINHLGHCALPSYTGVAEILTNLKAVLFPGYRGKTGLHAGNIRYHVGGLIASQGKQPRGGYRIGRTGLELDQLAGVDTAQSHERGRAVNRRGQAGTAREDHRRTEVLSLESGGIGPHAANR